MSEMSGQQEAQVQPASTPRVALLTNILLHHNVVVLEALQSRLPGLRVFLSATTEPDRKNPVDWGTLHVIRQKAFRWSYSSRNTRGYKDVTHLQIPYDTLQQLWSFHPDVLISNQFGGRTLQAVAYKMLRPRTVLIVWATLSQRTEAARRGLRLALRRWILRKADACFTHGHDSETYLRSLGFQKPIFHVPYVIEGDQFSGAYDPPRENRRTVLYTGQLIERKGIVPFVAAMSQWCEKHPELQVHFTLAGDGPQRVDLETLPRPENLHIDLVGHMSPEAIAKAYQTSSFCVFPTLGDEWGMVVHEALSAGVPILASVHAQASLELVQDGGNGWLFDPESAQSLAGGLDRAFAADREALLKMSATARDTVRDWTPEAMGNRMADAITQVSGT